MSDLQEENKERQFTIIYQKQKVNQRIDGFNSFKSNGIAEQNHHPSLQPLTVGM